MTVEQIIGKVFNIDSEDIHGSSLRESVGEWDSMGHLILIVELEENFNVSISTADVVEMVNVQKIKDILRKYGVDC